MPARGCGCCWRGLRQVLAQGRVGRGSVRRMHSVDPVRWHATPPRASPAALPIGRGTAPAGAPAGPPRASSCDGGNSRAARRGPCRSARPTRSCRTRAWAGVNPRALPLGAHRLDRGGPLAGRGLAGRAPPARGRHGLGRVAAAHARMGAPAPAHGQRPGRYHRVPASSLAGPGT